MPMPSHDVGTPCAERLAQPDLAGALGDNHQHDVHDHNPADHQRQPDDPDQHGKNAVRGLMVDVQNRVRRKQPEVVGLLRSQPATAAQCHDGGVHRRGHLRELARFDRQRERPPLSKDHLKLTKRNHDELVLRLPQHRTSFCADTHDAEMRAGDLNRLVDRVD